ncbi:hypothetical protein HBI24_201410 [Parastagonospora nodorum]|nr:hypothetical protein HBI24_201410 [Parastagonospora nodorum]
MHTFAWDRHDELIAKCSYLAHDLQTRADRAEARIAKEDTRDVSGEHHASIVKKWIFLQGTNRMAQETENLCEWELRGRRPDRTHSPFDAELAMHSRYAWTLDMGGQIRVSPLRALLQLDKVLELALVQVLEV